MKPGIDAYRIDASAVFLLAGCSTFWDGIRLHAKAIGALDPSYAGAMALLPDVWAEWGIPLSNWWNGAGGATGGPGNSEVVCFLTPHDITVIRTRLAKRRGQVFDPGVRRCWQFVADLGGFITCETDRVIVVVVGETRSA